MTRMSRPVAVGLTGMAGARRYWEAVARGDIPAVSELPPRHHAPPQAIRLPDRPGRGGRRAHANRGRSAAAVGLDDVTATALADAAVQVFEEARWVPLFPALADANGNTRGVRRRADGTVERF